MLGISIGDDVRGNTVTRYQQKHVIITGGIITVWQSERLYCLYRAIVKKAALGRITKGCFLYKSGGRLL